MLNGSNPHRTSGSPGQRPSGKEILSSLQQSPLGQQLVLASSLTTPSRAIHAPAELLSEKKQRPMTRSSARIVDSASFPRFLNSDCAAGVVVEFGGMTRLYPFLRKVIEDRGEYLPPIASLLTDSFLPGAKRWQPRCEARKGLHCSMRGLILQRASESESHAHEPLLPKAPPPHRHCPLAMSSQYAQLLTSLGEEALRVVSEDEHLVFDSLGGISSVVVAFLLSSSPRLLSSSPRDDFLNIHFSETLRRAGFQLSTPALHVAETGCREGDSPAENLPWEIRRIIGYRR
jgi:hypothetical protein